MLNIDPYTILWTLIDLLILFLLMKKFLFKPINAILDSRAKKIQDDTAQAEQLRAEAEQMHQQYEQLLAQSHEEGSQYLAQAKARGEELYQQTVAEAKQEAKKIRENSAMHNAHDRKQMLQSVREEVSSLVVLAAEKVAEKNSDAIDAFLEEVDKKS